MSGVVLDHVPRSLVRRLAEGARAWWPVPVVVAASLAAQHLFLDRRYDVGGHAAGHLAGAGAPFMAVAVAVLLVWSTPVVRRRPDVLLATAVWVATTVLVLVGNLRVVDDLVAAGHAFTPTSEVPDVADHGLANASVWYAWLAALLVLGTWRLRGLIGNRLAAGAIATSVVLPPWIIPGAGVIVLLIGRLVGRARDRWVAHRLPGVA